MQAWGHTSAVLALLANVNRDRKKHRMPFVPAEFDPYATDADVAAQIEMATEANRRGEPVTRENIDALKVMLPLGSRDRRGEAGSC